MRPDVIRKLRNFDGTGFCRDQRDHHGDAKRDLTLGDSHDHTVAITRAEYDAAKKVLRVSAASPRSDATLQVYVTSNSQLVGTLTNNGGGKYSGQSNWSVNPIEHYGPQQFRWPGNKLCDGQMIACLR